MTDRRRSLINAFKDRSKQDGKGDKQLKEKRISDTRETHKTVSILSDDIVDFFPDNACSRRWLLSPMVYSSEGVRHKNEDRYFMKSSIAVGTQLIEREVSCFAIFDGHGGERCAQFCADNIEEYLRTASTWSQENLSLEECMCQTIAHIINECENKFTPVSKAVKDTSGACVVIGLCCEGNICVANVGDCMAVLYLPPLDGNPEKIIELSVAHRSRNPSERCRIEKANGHIENHRAFGVLEPSRTIGDVDIKEYRIGAVTTEPHIKHVVLPLPLPPLLPKNKVSDRPFIVFASDGLWDVVDSAKVISNSRKSLRKWRKNPKKVNTARHLVRTALRHGTMDDATVIVVHIDS